MAALIEVTDVAALANLTSAHTANNRLAGCIASAEKTLRQWVGGAAVDDAAADDDASEAATSILKLACCYLTLYFAVPVLTSLIRTDGMVETDTSETARTLKFFTPEQIEKQQRVFWNMAKSVAAPYLTAVAGGIYAGGISKSDKDTNRANNDLVRPAFTRDLHDDPGIGPTGDLLG